MSHHHCSHAHNTQAREQAKPVPEEQQQDKPADHREYVYTSPFAGNKYIKQLEQMGVNVMPSEKQELVAQVEEATEVEDSDALIYAGTGILAVITVLVAYFIGPNIHLFRSQTGNIKNNWGKLQNAGFIASVVGLLGLGVLTGFYKARRKGPQKIKNYVGVILIAVLLIVAGLCSVIAMRLRLGLNNRDFARTLIEYDAVALDLAARVKNVEGIDPFIITTADAILASYQPQIAELHAYLGDDSSARKSKGTKATKGTKGTKGAKRQVESKSESANTSRFIRTSNKPETVQEQDGKVVKARNSGKGSLNKIAETYRKTIEFAEEVQRQSPNSVLSCALQWSDKLHKYISLEDKQKCRVSN